MSDMICKVCGRRLHNAVHTDSNHKDFHQFRISTVVQSGSQGHWSKLIPLIVILFFILVASLT